MKNVANATNYLDIDTKELFRIYSKDKDNKDVRNILIERHLYLVNLLAKKYINKGVEYEDLYQVGSLALIYAIDRYDIGKGYEFSSFATPTIIGEIKKYFRDKVWALRVPRRVQELSKKISEAKVALEQENKTHPKVKDIADYIGCSEEEVLEAMEASYGYQYFESYFVIFLQYILICGLIQWGFSILEKRYIRREQGQVVPRTGLA